jgi:hypothetical protein
MFTTSEYLIFCFQDTLACSLTSSLIVVLLLHWWTLFWGISIITLLTISHQITLLDNSLFILPATHFSILHCPFFPSPTLNHSLDQHLCVFYYGRWYSMDEVALIGKQNMSSSGLLHMDISLWNMYPIMFWRSLQRIIFPVFFHCPWNIKVTLCLEIFSFLKLLNDYLWYWWCWGFVSETWCFFCSCIICSTCIPFLANYVICMHNNVY